MTQKIVSRTAATVGRIVWAWASREDADALFVLNDFDTPLRADVVYVNDDGSVDLKVTDHRGDDQFLADIIIYEPREGLDRQEHNDATYATWMPYQSKQHAAQAARAENRAAAEQAKSA